MHLYISGQLLHNSCAFLLFLLPFRVFSSNFKSLYILEDPKGTRWYEANGEFISFQFQIVDLSMNKAVAECNKTKRWKNLLPGKFDDENDYSLTILDSQTDRRILLLFVIGIRQIRYYRMF